MKHHIEMKKRVVVIEDEEVTRLAITHLLRNRGFEVIACRNASACAMFLNCAHDCPDGQTCADIVITDVNMPRVTGPEFIRARMKQGCSIQHFGVMSAALHEAKADLHDMPEIRLFEKPFHLQDFMGWIEECQGKIDPRRELTLLPESPTNSAGFPDSRIERSHA